jgi:hypothetical protein
MAFALLLVVIVDDIVDAIVVESFIRLMWAGPDAIDSFVPWKERADGIIGFERDEELEALEEVDEGDKMAVMLMFLVPDFVVALMLPIVVEVIGISVDAIDVVVVVVSIVVNVVV